VWHPNYRASAILRKACPKIEKGLIFLVEFCIMFSSVMGLALSPAALPNLRQTNRRTSKMKEKMTIQELYELLSKRIDETDARHTQRIDTIESHLKNSNEENPKRFAALEQDIAWIRGKMEGGERTESDTRVRRATWIAGISVLIALASLIKRFFG